MPEIDFQEIQTKCTQLESLYSARNTLYDEYEKMHLMTPTETVDGVDSLTLSPKARNATTGAKHLMTATAPKFSVPFDKSDLDAQTASDGIEKFAAALWEAAGKVRQQPMEVDCAEASSVFGELVIAVDLVDDLIEAAKGGSASRLAQLEYAKSRCPVVFTVYDPRTCYPEYDGLVGLSSMYRVVKTKAGEILDLWGTLAEDAGLNPTQRNTDVEYCDYWDWDIHVAWIKGKGSPLSMEPHGKGIIPISAYITDGSRIWERPEQQRQALLYGYLKSGWWKRQNLLYTVMVENVRKMGLNATFKHLMADAGDTDLVIDGSMLGGVVHYRGQLGPLEKNLIDPSVIELNQLADAIAEETTIYRQALGGIVTGSNTAFSTVSLLNQAGRLPLTTIQAMTAQAIGRAMEIALKLMKAKGGGKTTSSSGVFDLKAADIPDGVIIECNVDVSLPQDERQNAMVAQQVTAGDTPLASKRWAREKILNIGQSADMEKEIWQEKYASLSAQMMFQQRMQQIQQPPQPQPGMGQPGLPPGQGMPPEMMPPQQGMPQEQGLPPEMQGMPPELLAQMQGAPGNGLPAMPMTGPIDQQGGPGMPPEMGGF